MSTAPCTLLDDTTLRRVPLVLILRVTTRDRLPKKQLGLRPNAANRLRNRVHKTPPTCPPSSLTVHALGPVKHGPSKLGKSSNKSPNVSVSTHGYVPTPPVKRCTADRIHECDKSAPRLRLSSRARRKKSRGSTARVQCGPPQTASKKSPTLVSATATGVDKRLTRLRRVNLCDGSNPRIQPKPRAHFTAVAARYTITSTLHRTAPTKNPSVAERPVQPGITRSLRKWPPA